MLQFWFLWLFIAIVVVIVAFTLRKERDDVPRKDILRAVETSAGSMGLAEKVLRLKQALGPRGIRKPDRENISTRQNVRFA